MDMTLSALSINTASIDTSSSVGIALVKKSLESIEANGDSLTKMMEASVTPYLGQNIDYTV